jgi:serralysin
VPIVTGTAGNDTLTGTSGNDTINGLGGNDLVLAGSTGGTDVVDGGAGSDSIDFSSRATSAVIVNFAAGTISGGSSGTISFTAVERVITGNFNDSLSGSAAAQTLVGQGGSDTLWGAGGIDTLWGGGGADMFVFRETGSANADSVRDWTSGSDKLVMDGTVMSALGATGNFAAGDARFKANSTGTATDSSDRVIYNTTTRQIFYDADGNGSGTAQLIATLQSGASFVATDIVVEGGSGGGGQTINGTSGNDSLVGGPGNDTINGFDGEDTIDGGAGVDSMVGGAHADTYFVDNTGDVIVELDGGGFDTVNASVSYTLPAWVNNLTLTGADHIGGTGNELPNAITGNSGDNILEGLDGHDLIDGGAGNDFFRPGKGDDTLFGGGGQDAFVINSGSSPSDDHGSDSIDGGEGVDWIAFSEAGNGTTHAVAINLGAGTYSIFDPAGAVHGAVLNVENVQGSEFSDEITGSEASNNLSGVAGNDTIRGLGGDDLLEAIFGNHLFDGGAGDDVLFGAFGSDTLAGGVGNDTLQGDPIGLDPGADTFLFNVAPGLANADLIRDFGSGPDLVLLDGTSHANAGLPGRFAAGDPRFWSSTTGTAHDADDRVIYNTANGQLWYDADGNGAGAAQVIATLLQGLGPNPANLSATDIAIVNGSGGGGSVINGTAGNDTLTGTAGNDTINGLGGNDLILVGSTGGADVIDGGAGFDSIDFSSRATSPVVVNFGAGTISGGSSGTISFTGVERVIAGNFNDSVTGSAAAQTLVGQGGADTLWGAGGVDVLWGGGGTDTFVFRETGGANADSIRDWTSGSDKVALDDAVMTALGATGNFVAGDARFKANSTGTATDANDRVIHNTSTGSLYYDADGSGAGAAQIIATFAGNPTVAATDIVVI